MPRESMTLAISTIPPHRTLPAPILSLRLGSPSLAAGVTLSQDVLHGNSSIVLHCSEESLHLMRPWPLTDALTETMPLHNACTMTPAYSPFAAAAASLI